MGFVLLEGRPLGLGGGCTWWREGAGGVCLPTPVFPALVAEHRSDTPPAWSLVALLCVAVPFDLDRLPSTHLYPPSGTLKTFEKVFQIILSVTPRGHPDGSMDVSSVFNTRTQIAMNTRQHRTREKLLTGP